MKKNTLKQTCASYKTLVMGAVALLLSSCGGTNMSTEKNVLIPVNAGDTYVYVNNRGEIMEPEVNVTETSAFYGNYAVAGKEKKGFIDKSGKLVIPMQYAEATIFSDGLAFVRETRNSTVTAIDTKGKEVFRLQDSNNARRFSEGMAAFLDNKKNRWGFVDKTGKVVIEPQYEEAGDFSCGLAAVGSRDAYGFIDAKGKLTIETQFSSRGFGVNDIEKVRFTDEGFCVVGIGVGRNTLQGVINKKGDFIIQPMECSYIEADKGGFIVNTEHSGGTEAMYFDVNGNISIVGFEYLFPFNGGKYTVAMPSIEDEFVIIDRKGKTVAEISFSPVFFISSFMDGMAVAQNSGHVVDGQSIINEKGKKIVDVDRVYVADDYGTYSEQNYFKLR